MSQRSSSDVLATIVITPRERFSTAFRCLPDIIANTQTPHRLVYVAGGAPPYVRRFLEETCAEHGYELILRPEYLATNPARNLGLQRVTTRYAVFLDNDVVVEPGWLDALLSCAEDTGAAVVGPLCMIGEWDAGVVHSTGGDLLVTESASSRTIQENHRYANVDGKARQLEVRRSACDYVEFHCMLVRTSLFDDTDGLMDPDILAAAEHIDIALVAKQRGEKTYTEPRAAVSYLHDAPYVLGDVDFFEQRWSEEWHAATLDHLAHKWSLGRDSSFFHDYQSWTTNHRTDCQLPRVTGLPLPVVSSERHPFAQTILRLTAQMRTAGYGVEDVRAVQAAYHTVSRIHAGVYRESGKTLVAHVVGTASVLAAYGSPVSVIVAALLHAAYPLGRLPDHLGSDIVPTRRWLASKIGDKAEAQVFDYVTLDFEQARHAVADGTVDQLPLRAAYAILMRIANSIDEHLDDGLLHTRDAAAALAANSAQNERWGQVYRAIAHALRCDAMLDVLLTLHTELLGKVALTAPMQPAGLDNYVFEDGEPVALQPRRWQTGALVAQQPELPAPSNLPVLERVRNKVGVPLRQFSKDDLTVANDAVLQEPAGYPARLFTRRLARLITGPQWSYSCTLRLDRKGKGGAAGEAFLRLVLLVSEGELGVGILSRGSTTEFLVPEQLLRVSRKPVELILRLPDLRDAGTLVMRSSAPSRTVADIHALSLHAPLEAATPQSQRADARTAVPISTTL